MPFFNAKYPIICTPMNKVSDAELVDEFDRRKLYASTGSVTAINQIADAFALKKHDQAMRMLENLIYDVTGRIVPLI